MRNETIGICAACCALGVVLLAATVDAATVLEQPRRDLHVLELKTQGDGVEPGKQALQQLSLPAGMAAFGAAMAAVALWRSSGTPRVDERDQDQPSSRR